MYSSEQVLQDELVTSLLLGRNNHWRPLTVATEFFYMRGRTDVIATSKSNHVIAFEVKLRKWKEALHQAYRNTCFAHFSYVVVPEEIAARIAEYEPEFSRMSVGLCYITSQMRLVVSVEAQRCDPIQPWLTEKALNTIRRSGEVAQPTKSFAYCSGDMPA